MIGIFLIAIAAGCASALMFASITSGALISLLLFYLAPLPLMVAALGWGPLSAAIVVKVAKLAIQSRIRPTGYDSSSGGAAPLPGEALPSTGRPSSARCPSHQAGSATVNAKARQ